MSDYASALVKKLARLGELIGFEAQKEVSKSILALRYEGGKQYMPRLDLLWSMELEKKQAAAISEIVGGDADTFVTLPIVGIEVEATDPTTKILESDFANIAALGPPVGLIASNSEYKEDIYWRAARVIRYMRHSHGDICVFPFDAIWIPGAMTAMKGTKPRMPMHVHEAKTTGGEKKWTSKVRKKLRDMGAAAGFDIAEEWTPPLIENAFAVLKENVKEDRAKVLWRPTGDVLKTINNAGKYMTASRLDVVWLAKTKPRFIQFLRFLCDKDPGMREFLLLNPEDWARIPIVGFEIESSAGKHAGGGLLNLAAHTIIGVSVVPHGEVKRMEGKLATYRTTLGLRNVYVRSDSCIT